MIKSNGDIMKLLLIIAVSLSLRTTAAVPSRGNKQEKGMFLSKLCQSINHISLNTAYTN